MTELERQQIGILHHPYKPESQPLAMEIERWLRQQEIPAWVRSTWDSAFVQQQMPACRLLVVIGGDGSILRAARLAAPHHVPLYSINMGRLGFLAEAQPDAWVDKLGAILAGKHWIEERLMLVGEVFRDGQAIARRVALNDLVVSRGTQARVLRLELLVNGDYVTRYVADGVIAATPTGSTAYALAAGGPILPPALLNYLVVPVAPHLSLDRALVLHQEAVVTIEVAMDHEATLTADGQDDTVNLHNGDRVIVRKNAFLSRFARVGNASYFYRRLMERLRLEVEPQ